MEKLVIGKIVNTIGLKGEVKVLPYTDNIKNLEKLRQVELADFSYVLQVEYCKIHGNMLRMKFKGYDNVDLVMSFKNKYLQVERESTKKLNNNEYFLQDILNAKLYNKNEFIGEIYEINNFGAGNIAFFKNKNVDGSFPLIQDIFESVDVENKKILVTNKFFEVVVEWK